MKNRTIVFIAASTVFLTLLALQAWYPARLGAGLLLIGLLPGYGLLTALWPDVEAPFADWLEKLLMAVAVSYGLTILLLLIIAFGRVPLNVLSVAAGLGGVTLVCTIAAWFRTRHQPDSSPTAARALRPARFKIIMFVAILVTATIFRVVNVSYSDHQGDEADILLRAVMLTYGQVESLLTHSKGPGEILLLDGIGTLTGNFGEQTVRLPFAVAGTISVGLIFLLGWLLFNPLVGSIAGLLAAIDGVFVSYARTAQYQSVVLLLTLAAMWCFYRFRQAGGQSWRLHGLGTFLLAVSFLVHFETILLVPVVVYLTIAPFGGPGAGSRIASDVWRHLWPSLVILIVIVSFFYIPFLLNPAVSKTGAYLENRIGGGESPPFNNLRHFFYFEALKYNSAYFVSFFNSFLLIQLFFSLAEALWGRDASKKFLIRTRIPLFLCLVGAALGFGLALAGFPKLSGLLAALVFALFFGLIILSANTSPAQRTLWLWIGPPFWVYVFLVNRPGKHHYLFLGALTLLVSLAVVNVWRWLVVWRPDLMRPAARRLMAGLAVMLLVVFAAHTLMLFLRSDLEYVLTYPAHKSTFYPTDSDYPYGTRIGFGYPFRLGWQVVGQLKRAGKLEGTWAANDEGNAPNWYMLNTPAAPCYPDYVLHGAITYRGSENFDVPFNPTEFGYIPRYQIWGNDGLRMTILAFDPQAGDVQPVNLEDMGSFDPPVTAADFSASLAFPATANVPPGVVLAPPLVLGEGSELKNNAPPEYVVRAQQLNGRVALLGYDLDPRYAVPGGVLPVTLHWQMRRLLSLRYKVFVHLVAGDGQIWAQADDFPVCGTSHANTWEPGSTVLDRHLLKLSPDLPPGEYALVVGMYEPDLNLRLNYFDIAENEQGNSLMVGSAVIQPH